MSTYKKLTSKDVIITPFEVNKSFSFVLSSSFIPDNGINGFVGQNLTSSFDPLTDPTSGNPSLYNRLVYHSAKQLYYGNYLSGSNGFISNASTASFNSDGTITGPVYTTNYKDYLESSIYSFDRTSLGVGAYKYFPTESNAYIAVFSIPTKLFGNNIIPGTFKYGGFVDDGQGNLTYPISGTNGPQIIGNIFYSQGIIVITKNWLSGFVSDSFFFNSQDKNNWTDSPFSFTSSLVLYETQYKCTIRENEFNYSMNPTLLISGGLDQTISGKATYQDFVTGSDFSPYVTTVGLYDEDQNLLAVGKLAKPLPTSQTTDTTIIINLDLN